MGSASSQVDDGQESYFHTAQSPRIRHSSLNKPVDTRSTVLRKEKTKRDIKAKEERELNEQNGFTPFTPRGTIGYSSKQSHIAPDGTTLAAGGGLKGKRGKRGRSQSARNASVSFYAKNVYISDEDDRVDDELDFVEEPGLHGKEKVESYLRKSRVAETKVRDLAVRVWELAVKEIHDQEQQAKKDTTAMCASLRTTINQPLDVLLFGKTNKTSLKKIEDNLEELVLKISEMVELLEVDVALCLDSAERHLTGKKGTKSVPLLVRDAVMALEADYDILHEKYHDLRREKEEAVQQQTKTRNKSEVLEQTSVQMEKEYKRLVEHNRDLCDYVQELKDHKRQSKTSHQHLSEENLKLKKQVQWYQESNAIVHKDLMRLQDTCAQLQVQSIQQAKEIRRLRDPDKEMLYKIQRLETELTEAKTANRKLELEKGKVKTSLQKLQAHYDGLQSERGTLVKQRHKLQKENEKIKTTNKKLKLSS